MSLSFVIGISKYDIVLSLCIIPTIPTYEIIALKQIFNHLYVHVDIWFQEEQIKTQSNIKVDLDWH
jgi:hypothetical protein